MGSILVLVVMSFEIGKEQPLTLAKNTHLPDRIPDESVAKTTVLSLLAVLSEPIEDHCQHHVAFGFPLQFVVQIRPEFQRADRPRSLGEA